MGCPVLSLANEIHPEFVGLGLTKSIPSCRMYPMSENSGPDEMKILSLNEAAGYEENASPYTGGNYVESLPEETTQNWTSEDELPPRQDAEQRRIGRFIVLGDLGRGGMGSVLKGKDPLSGRIVALKILDDSALKERETLIRFEREANAAADLDHPNIARMYGIHYDDEGQPFIVMEYIDGTPLDRINRERFDLLFSQIIDWICQVARGLEYARRRGIIHRDIKPANIIIDTMNTARIIDFGLAKSMWDTTGVTATGMVVGTPRYMSPEQGMGRNVDHRSDVYALGATLYELITKQTPFDGDTPMSIMMKHINSPLTPPYVLHPKCPSDVNEIVVKMLAKDPNQRYQDYEPLIHDLESARIHRLAKEKAQEALNPDDFHGSPTMLELDPASHSYTHGSGSSPKAKRPNPYLSEGLVKLDMSSIPDPEDGPRSPTMMVTIGIILLIVTGILYYRQSTAEETASSEPGWLQKTLTATFGEQRSESMSVEETYKKEKEDIETTAARMDALKTLVNRYRRAKGGEIPTLRQLKIEGLLTIDAMGKDAWGNALGIRKEGNDIIILSWGMDGNPGTVDDFRIPLDSNRRQIPRVRTFDEIAVGNSGKSR